MEPSELLQLLNDLQLPVRVIGSGGVVTHAIIGRLANSDDSCVFLVAERPAAVSKQFLNTLGSSVCVCGSTKKNGKVVCGICYSVLPPAIRLGIQNNVGRELEDTYTFALIALARRGRNASQG